MVGVKNASGAREAVTSFSTQTSVWVACGHRMLAENIYLRQGDCDKLLNEASGVERGGVRGGAERIDNGRRPLLLYAAVRVGSTLLIGAIATNS